MFLSPSLKHGILRMPSWREDYSLTRRASEDELRFASLARRVSEDGLLRGVLGNLRVSNYLSNGYADLRETHE